MDEKQGFEELAYELLVELGAIGRVLGPAAINLVRGELAVLMALFEAREPLSPTVLGERTHLTSARMANILRALEEKGYVVREHAARDRRGVLVRITEAGAARAEQVRADGLRAVVRFLEELGPDDAREMVRLIHRSRSIVDGYARTGVGA